MRLSELNTDQTLDVLCEITPHLTEIAKDDHLMSELKRTFEDDKEKHTLSDFIELGASKMNAVIPILLKEKRDAVYGILSAINGKTVDEIGKQKGYVTIKEIYNLLNDKELIDFFKSCVDMEGSE